MILLSIPNDELLFDEFVDQNESTKQYIVINFLIQGNIILLLHQ
jgi:hypothetical protein